MFGDRGLLDGDRDARVLHDLAQNASCRARLAYEPGFGLLERDSG
jgi:hypothetical protein